MIEFNYGISSNKNRIIYPYRDSRRWAGTKYYGIAISAMTAIGQAHGYTLVYGETNSVHLFFVQ